MIYTQFEGPKNVNILDNSSVFYVCLFDVKLPEDDLQNTEMSEYWGTVCEIVLLVLMNYILHCSLKHGCEYYKEW
jgi:hypothetical protein